MGFALIFKRDFLPSNIRADMMDTVINKLRNTVTTVTSTVSQLSVVLPGNPVTREFEIEQHIASAGPGMTN